MGPGPGSLMGVFYRVACLKPHLMPSVRSAKYLAF